MSKQQLPATKAFRDLRAGLALAERELDRARSPEDVLSIDQKLAALRKVIVAAGLGARADLDVFLLRMEAKRKGGELLGEPPGQGSRTDKHAQRVQVPNGLNRGEAHRWRLLRWRIAQTEWDEMRQKCAASVTDADGLQVRWSQTDYLSLARGTNVHFSSGTPEWYTPADIIERVVQVLGAIDLDPCSDGKNVPAKKHFTETDDGLAQSWQGRVYMNPPYGQGIAKWISKLIESYESRAVMAAVALVPARPDTDWFECFDAYLRCFVHGRLKFSAHENSAPFPSMVVYLGPNEGDFIERFSELGGIYELRAGRTAA